MSHLHGIGHFVNLYSEEHNGKLPRNLPELVGDGDWLGNAQSLFRCPGSRGTPGALTNVVVWMDYHYALVPRSSSNRSDCALIYDRRLSNHSGTGINVAIIGLLDTPLLTPSALFWDKNAKWLSKFAEQHPDLAIPMPK
jgi:hypothetical protein